MEKGSGDPESKKIPVYSAEDLPEKEECFSGSESGVSAGYYKRLASAEILTAERELALWEEMESCYDRIRRIFARFACTYAHLLHHLESCNTPEDLTDIFAQSLFSGKNSKQQFLQNLPEIRLEFSRIHESLFGAYHCSDSSLLEKLYKQGEALFVRYPFPGELIFREVAHLQKHLLVLESPDTDSAKLLLDTELLCSRELFLTSMTEIAGLIRSLDRGRELLVESNLRLVASIVRQYQNRGVPFVDLLQEGNMGLLKAIEKFDYRLGHRFSTYATWWIKQSVTHAVRSQSRVIRLPVHMLTVLSRINKAEQQFLQEHGREAQTEEIARILGLSRARVNSLKRMALQPISLQMSAYTSNDGKELSFGETLQDIKDEDNPVKSLARKLLEQKLHALLDTLPQRTREILCCRFGLNGVEPMSLNEMSQHFHVSRERIRQIENNALMHLRNPEMITLLEDYFL